MSERLWSSIRATPTSVTIAQPAIDRRSRRGRGVVSRTASPRRQYGSGTDRRPTQAPLARRHRRPREDRCARHAPGRGHGRRRLREAPDRRGLELERDHSLQPLARPARQGREERRARGRRLPAGVRHDLGLRRHRDGPRGDALLAGQPRGHRRLGRDRDDGRAARRLGAAGRLRQEPARHDDGRGAARPGQRLPLRRLDHAGPGRRPRRHDHRRLRGGRRLPGRARSPARRSTGSSARSARARAPAAACTPPTPWPPSPRRSG